MNSVSITGRLGRDEGVVSAASGVTSVGIVCSLTRFIVACIVCLSARGYKPTNGQH
jgi:hypothetical protein